MGQFKKGKQDTIVIGEGHSLMLGHMPNSIPSDAYSELNFGLNKSGIVFGVIPLIITHFIQE
jgi:hypothetical protein